jgi:small subunit ribosomal protein S17
MSETQAAAAPNAPKEGVREHAHSYRRKMTGKVVRDKMNKTVTVEVTNSRRDPLEHRPISRDKRFIVIRLIKKFVEE